VKQVRSISLELLPGRDEMFDAAADNEVEVVTQTGHHIVISVNLRPDRFPARSYFAIVAAIIR